MPPFMPHAFYDKIFIEYAISFIFTISFPSPIGRQAKMHDATLIFLSTFTMESRMQRRKLSAFMRLLTLFSFEDDRFRVCVLLTLILCCRLLLEQSLMPSRKEPGYSLLMVMGSAIAADLWCHTFYLRPRPIGHYAPRLASLSPFVYFAVCAVRYRLRYIFRLGWY